MVEEIENYLKLYNALSNDRIEEFIEILNSENVPFTYDKNKFGIDYEFFEKCILHENDEITKAIINAAHKKNFINIFINKIFQKNKIDILRKIIPYILLLLKDNEMEKTSGIADNILRNICSIKETEELIEFLEDLHELGLDKHVISSKDYYLFDAAKAENLKIIEILLEYGANYKIKDEDGKIFIEYLRCDSQIYIQNKIDHLNNLIKGASIFTQHAQEFGGLTKEILNILKTEIIKSKGGFKGEIITNNLKKSEFLPLIYKERKYPNLSHKIEKIM